jgi:hypothetical protein
MADFVYPSGWTDVANQALSHLGSKRINNLLDGSALATSCQQFMGRAIEDVYSEIDWQAATKRVELERLTEAPAYGFLYYYQLPVDYIRMMVRDSVDVGGATWAIEQDRLATDAEEAYLRYIARPLDPAKIPGYLRQAIEIWLAVLLTIPLASSDERKAVILALWSDKKAKALAADASARQQEEPPQYWDELR